MINGYQYKFYLNASHAIYIGGALGQVHPHTWELSIEVVNQNKDLILFNKVQPMIDRVLDQYQNNNINTIEPFDKINPTLENITEYFMKIFRSELKKMDMMLTWIEVSETASISYFINVLDEVESALSIPDAEEKVESDEIDGLIDQMLQKEYGK